MSKITIECDGCRKAKTLAVRQPHEARAALEAQGWTTVDDHNRYGSRKKDYCEECSS